jgi:hypothetical protein
MGPFAPTHAVPEHHCPVCHGTVRQARARADVTVLLDAEPVREGVFYYVPDERGRRDRVVEDPYARAVNERFTRHRCAPVR